MIFYEDIGIRPIQEGDLEAVRRIRNDETTFRNLTDARMITPAMQRAWFDAIGTAKDRAYFVVVKVERDGVHPIMTEGAVVGMVRTTEIDTANRSVCVGADVAPEWRGKGYGTKIYRAFLRYLFRTLGFNRAWLLVIETNAVARKLYENVGFKVEGVQRQAIWRDGRWQDYVSMSLLKDEYRASEL
jgi:RimJ/RimL family protein N-acetyltransferase